MNELKEICEKLSSQDPAIDRAYWSSCAAVALPRAIGMIESLRALLIESEALCRHRWIQLDEGERRAWEELSSEEQEARLWYSERLLKMEHPELFA